VEKQGATARYLEYGECTPANTPSDLWQANAKSVVSAVWACTVWGTQDASNQPVDEERGEDVGFSVSFGVDASGAIVSGSLGCV
jgi:hypothetical protein